MKVAIIGYCGAGKSTLARRLGERYGCPVLHFDQVGWSSGWVARDRDAVRADVARFLDGNDAWVIDGNYGDVDKGRRLDEADRIISLEYPRRICLAQAYRRYRDNKGRVREDMAEGCPEKFDFEFIRWILFDGRNARRMRFYRRAAERYPEKFMRARSHEELEEILARLP